jgi:hypothetical protein
MSFASEVNAFVIKTEAKIGEAARKPELDMLRDVVLMTPVDTGRARGGWQFAVDSPDFAEGGADPSGAAAIARGTPKILNAPIGKGDWFLANGVPYILPLEFGWSKQAPAGMARIAAARFTVSVERAAAALANR